MPVPCWAGAAPQIFELVSKQNETRIKVFQRHLTETADWAVSSTIFKIPEKIQEPQEVVLISTILEHPLVVPLFPEPPWKAQECPVKGWSLSRTNSASVQAQEWSCSAPSAEGGARAGTAVPTPPASLRGRLKSFPKIWWTKTVLGRSVLQSQLQVQFLFGPRDTRT